MISMSCEQYKCLIDSETHMPLMTHLDGLVVFTLLEEGVASKNTGVHRQVHAKIACVAPLNLPVQSIHYCEHVFVVPNFITSAGHDEQYK